MKPVIISCLLILQSVYVHTQSILSDSSAISIWLGEFSGTLHMYNKTSETKQIPMKVKHFKTDTADVYGWYIIYGEDEKSGTREYYLKEKDAETGHYIIDEKNGILLDAHLFANKIISDYKVAQSTITSIYTRKDDNTLIFEIIAGDAENTKVTGGNGEIPSVYSTPIVAYQYAELKRIR